jgi:hypothetical protein
MMIGIQELIALTFVVIVVGFALYRRWRKKRDRESGCSDCAGSPAQKNDEAPIHIYRRHD